MPGLTIEQLQAAIDKARSEGAVDNTIVSLDVKGSLSFADNAYMYEEEFIISD